MKPLLYAVCLFFIFYACQNENQAKNQQKQTELLSFYLDELERNNTKSSDTLMILSEEIIELFPQQKAEVAVKLGNLFYAKSKFYLSQYYFKLAAKTYKKSGEEELYAEQLTNIGVLNEIKGDYTTSIINYFEALSIFKKLNLELKTSYIYNNLGIVYQQLKEKEKALKYYKKGLDIVLTLDRSDLSASKYNNIASIFEEFDGELDSALVYYNKAYTVSIVQSEPLNIASIEGNIANIYIQQGLLDKADSLLNIALLSSQLNNNLRTVNLINRFKSELYLKQGNIIKAESFARTTIALAKNESYKEIEVEGLSILIEVLVKKEEYKEAFLLLNRKNEIESNLSGTAQKNRIEQLRMSYEVNEKDNKIELLELRKSAMEKRGWILTFILSALFLVLLISLYIVYLKNKHSVLLIKQMQRDISDYVKLLHRAEEELHENELSQSELISQKVKQFNLTEREDEVLILIAKGYTNTEIADQMFVSVNTIKTHIKNLFIKLDVRNRIEATKKTKLI
jgi:ATP/maltotriose-dependent transcriptional regulator MalT